MKLRLTLIWALATGWLLVMPAAVLFSLLLSISSFNSPFDIFEDLKVDLDLDEYYNFKPITRAWRRGDA